MKRIVCDKEDENSGFFVKRLLALFAAGGRSDIGYRF
jgi:hypothetical protein